MKKYVINYSDKLHVHSFHLKLYFTTFKMKIPLLLNYIIILLMLLMFILNGCGDSGLTLVFMPSPTPGITEEIYNMESISDSLFR